MLGLRIRQHHKLTGFNFGYNEKSVKVVQYADDCVLFLNDKNELCEAISLLDNFGKISGLILNLSKCEGMWLGKDKGNQTNCKLYGIKWPVQVRCLGIYVGYCKDNNFQQNWIEKLDKAEQIIKCWDKRILTLIGKIHIIKTFIISQFILPATLLVVPDGVIKRLESMLFRFLWGKKDKVNRLRTIQSLDAGGLNMIDVKTLFKSLKAIWVNKLIVCNPNIHSWAQIPYNYFKSFLNCNTNLCFNFDKHAYFPEVQRLSMFYQEVFIHFNNACVCDLDEFKWNISQQCIWGNQFITVKRGRKKCVLFLRNWIRSGVNGIKDLRFVDGKLDENFVLHKIRDSNNIWQEMFIVKNALLPYQEYLRNITTSTSVHPCLKFRKSKEYYVLFHEIVTNDVPSVTHFLAKYYTGDNALYIYRKKIRFQKETKLKEFNFKLLHGILPCNLNLFRWKIRESDQCDVCGLPQNIEHLLFACVYVKPLWQKVEQTFDVRVNFDTIVGIHNDVCPDFLITLLSFLIYKEWLIHSLDNQCRSNNIIFDFYKQELCLRIKIYNLCTEILPTDLESVETFANTL